MNSSRVFFSTETPVGLGWLSWARRPSPPPRGGGRLNRNCTPPRQGVERPTGVIIEERPFPPPGGTPWAWWVVLRPTPRRPGTGRSSFMGRGGPQWGTEAVGWADGGRGGADPNFFCSTYHTYPCIATGWGCDTTSISVLIISSSSPNGAKTRGETGPQVGSKVGRVGTMCPGLIDGMVTCTIRVV